MHWAAMLACVGGIVAIGALGFFVPRGYWPIFGSNEFGNYQSLTALNVPLRPMDTETFVYLLRLCLGCAWLGYGVLLIIASVSRTAVGRMTKVTAVALALVIASFAPPWLSSDTYAYLAYARMQVLYGINPYAFTTSALQAVGDPLSSFFLWDVVSSYGPAWTFITAAVVAVLSAFPLIVQVIAMKWLAAAAHVALAFGVARLAQLVAPQLKDAAFVLIAFSPLYVMEAAGSGHNDAAMLALSVWGVVAWQLGLLRRACLLLGLAGAVKFLPFMLLFWLIGQRWFRQGRDWRSATLLLCIGMAPFVVLQLFFLSQDAAFLAALSAHFSSAFGKHAMPATQWIIPFLIVLGACSVAVVMTRLMHWTVAWTLVTVLAVFLIGPPWPWYLMWPGVFLLAGYSRYLKLAVIPFVFSGFMLMLGYSMIP